MPRVLGYTPSWLSRPSPGFDLFAHKQFEKPIIQDSTSGEKAAASRTIACRGAEIFVAVDKEIRWSDLQLLKEEWQQHPDVTSSAFEDGVEETSGDRQAAHRVEHSRILDL